MHPNGPQVAFEAQLAGDDSAAPSRVLEHGWELLAGDQHAECYGQVERRALLWYVGRSQVHGDAAEGQRIPGVGQRGGDPLLALTHRTLGKPDRVEAGQPTADVDLDIDQVGVDAEHSGGADAGEHPPRYTRLRRQPYHKGRGAVPNTTIRRSGTGW
jgi:hypothetical protein